MESLAKKLADKRYEDKIRQYVDSYKKTGKCVICGEDRFACLDFHHKDKQDKKYTIGNILRNCGSMPKVIEEIKKCIVVCANCHRVLHASDNGDNTPKDSKNEIYPLFN